MILIADDDLAVLETTALLLERQGYKTITATDGAKAVSVYEQNKDLIDVILLDLMMPVMEGDKTIEVLRRINPKVKIIVLSGFTNHDRYQKAIEKAQACLAKPYTMREILAAIQKVLAT